LKILLTTTHLEFGGISSYTVFLAKKLKNRGHYVAVASSGGALIEELKKNSIEHIKINIRTKCELNPKLITATLRLLKFVKENNIELIHAQTRITQVAALYLSKLSGIPYVTTCHGFFKPRFTRKVFKCWGERVIAISEAVRAHLVYDLKVPKDKIDLIHNGVDLKDFLHLYTEDQKNKYKSEIKLKKGPVVGIIARISGVKGHKYLLQAAKQILKERPDVQFLIIGDGPEKKNLLKLADELQINENTYFLPSTLEIALPLSIMDIFCLPSLQEGLGLSIIEAMASSVAVVASNAGGIYSLVEDGKNGFLVQPGNDKQLKVAILKLLNNKRMAKIFGREGKRKVIEEFSLDILVKKAEETYQKAMGRI
jgi:glycosyltransferase involved in cell wall biosynthesis